MIDIENLWKFIETAAKCQSTHCDDCWNEHTDEIWQGDCWRYRYAEEALKTVTVLKDYITLKNKTSVSEDEFVRLLME